MSRATASNYLNPHLRRRSRSGVFETPSSSSAANAGQTAANTSINAASGAATISVGTKARLGLVRPGVTADKQYLQRPSYVATSGSGTDEEDGAIAASAAAAGAAGRPRRMTHQATRLTIDPERAKAGSSVVDASKRTPLTATDAGPGVNRRRFMRTPSTHELQTSASEHISSSSDKDGTEGTTPTTSGHSLAKRSSTTYSGASHRPLQAKFETSSGAGSGSGGGAGRAAGRPSIGGGAKLPTWRTQQAVRESIGGPHRTPATYTGVAGTKVAARENGSQPGLRGRSSGEYKNDGEAKTQQSRLRPVQSKPLQPSVPVAAGPRAAGSISSSASAIGVGSTGVVHQQMRGAPRAGAAASVIGAVPPSQVPAPSVPMQTHPLVGQSSVRPQIAGYQQRFAAPQKGPLSTVSAAPASTQQTTNLHNAAAASKQAAADQAAAAKQQQQGQSMSVSRPQSSNHASSRMSGQSPDAGNASGGMSPLTPQEAIARYGQQLSAQERTEILEFPHVYYVGSGKARVGGRAGYGFDDERGDYIIHLNDHMLYRYELLEVLGKGSFGQVLRARDHKTGDIVAIKIIRNRKRFHHQAQVEVKLLECLRRWDPSGAHNILQMTASFYFRNHLCIVMELLSINLYEWLKAHQFAGTPVPLLRHLTVQMLQALQLMGRHRIIHADLKPENILLMRPPPMPTRRAAPPGAAGPPPHPLSNPQLAADVQRGAYGIKVIDLGSSCFETERVYTYIQSRFYRAPEVILGLPYGTGIDMWSLGCIVAELLTGYPLFPGENEREQLACVVEVLGPPPAYMLERAPRCADFAEPAPYGVQATPVGNMMLLPNGACMVGNIVIKPYTNSKGKRRRPGSRPLVQILARARDPRLVDFVMRTLAWDPAARMSPEEALCHPWITEMAIARQPAMGMGMGMGMGMAMGMPVAAGHGAPLHPQMGGVPHQIQQQPGYVMAPPGG
ncbi:serine/threonine protein kinase, CMGC, dual-specificity, partial [Coemansia sp. RSA 2599]